MKSFDSLSSDRNETRLAGVTLCGIGLLLGAAVMDGGAVPEFGIPGDPAGDEFGTLAKGRRRGLALSAGVIGLGTAVIAKPDASRAIYDAVMPVIEPALKVLDAVIPGGTAI